MPDPHHAPQPLQTALAEVVGSEHVHFDPAGIASYTANTLPGAIVPLGAVRPGSVEQVQQVMRIAADHDAPVYPISRGRNWGYGSANPVRPGCLVLDCSRMNRILEFDADLGLVTVEPGVSQAMLDRFLRDQSADLLVPTTGAGPDASILGNALERGYGITPHADHFGAVTAIEAVLADGRLYRSALTEMGAAQVDQSFKWGVGPYIDGLLAQSNLAVVTRATIALAPRPQRVMGFFFSVRREEDLENAVTAVRNINREAGGAVGAINLMNRRRVLSMMVPYPQDEVGDGGVMSDELVQRLGDQHGVGPWMGAGVIYGDPRIASAVKRIVRRHLRPHTRQLVFITLTMAQRLKRWIDRLPAGIAPGFRRRVHTLEGAMRNFAGEPSEVALPLSYWKSGRKPDADAERNPARDGCGLIWYSPLVPVVSRTVREYVAMVEQVCEAHGVEPLITLTALSQRCFDSTVPLLYDRDDPGESRRASACFEALFTAGRQRGLMPYRVNVNAMSMMVDPEQPFWQLAGRIKQCFDPQGLISPGRYCPDTRTSGPGEPPADAPQPDMPDTPSQQDHRSQLSRQPAHSAAGVRRVTPPLGFEGPS